MHTMRRGRPGIIFVPLLLACSGSSSPVAPSSNAVVTFGVLNETFRVSLTTAGQVAAARAAQAGGTARIPIGRVVPGAEVNSGWSWHLEDVMFGEATPDACDGRPSDVEKQGVKFGGDRYCPWAATILDVVDK